MKGLKIKGESASGGGEKHKAEFKRKEGGARFESHTT